MLSSRDNCFQRFQTREEVFSAHQSGHLGRKNCLFLENFATKKQIEMKKLTDKYLGGSQILGKIELPIIHHP